MDDLTTYELIQEVKKRPVLWNKHEPNYGSKIHLLNEWKEIGIILKAEHSALRTKWKSLRCYYKGLSKRNGQPTKLNGNKWGLYDSLAFLNEANKNKSNANRPTYGIVKEIKCGIDALRHVAIAETAAKEIAAAEAVAREIAAARKAVVRQADLREVAVIHAAAVAASKVTVEEIVIPKEEIEIQPCPESCNCTVTSSSNLEHVIKTTTRKQTKDEDYDAHFVKSLLPFYKSLTSIRKLRVMGQFQNILIKEHLAMEQRRSNVKANATKKRVDLTTKNKNNVVRIVRQKKVVKLKND